MVGHWSMDSKDGSNNLITPDISGYNNSGTVTSATFTNEGKFKEGYEFDGVFGANRDYISIADDDNYDFDAAENFSITAWIKPDDIFSASTRTGIVSKRYTETHYWQFTLHGTNVLEFYVSNGTGASNKFLQDVGTITANGEWYFVAVSANRETNGWKLYINGVQKDVDTLPSHYDLINSHPMTIGWEQANNKNFNGTIDEVKIYSRALTSTEIGKLYNGSKSNRFVLRRRIK